MIKGPALHLPLRLLGAAALLLWLGGSSLLAPAAAAASKDEDLLVDGCDWLERAILREPERDDSFGMFMRGMRPKCQAMLEGLARKDNSVRPDAVQQIVKEIGDLRTIIDGEHGAPPPATTGPTPAERARQKIEEEKAAKDKLVTDKAAADKAAADKAAADKAAAEKAAADKAAAEKAEQEAKKAAERENREETAAEKKAAEEARKAAEREAREKAAADKKAAEEAKRAAEREERERIAAEKKAAEEARKTAEREERERAAAEKLASEEARKAAEREAKARQEGEREAIKAKAQALVDAEMEAEKKKAEAASGQTPAPAPAAAKAPAQVAGKGGVDGTWEQPETKVLDRRVKRTLNLLTKDKKVQGELFEEVWFAAPSAWIDKSCGGNETFRMVTTARVNGEIDGKRIELWRDPPRVLTCTCSSRCTVESRRRGMDLAIGASGAELSDQTGVFVRPGTAIVTKAAEEGGAPGTVIAPVDFVGNWETAPFSVRDRSIVQRLELQVSADGIVSGLLVERSAQDFPLASWRERFCGGSNRWEWVTQWTLEGKVSGKKAAIKAKDGQNLLCTCPSKCTPPKDKLGFELVFGATGANLRMGDRAFERR